MIQSTFWIHIDEKGYIAKFFWIDTFTHCYLLVTQASFYYENPVGNSLSSIDTQTGELKPLRSWSLWSWMKNLTNGIFCDDLKIGLSTVALSSNFQVVSSKCTNRKDRISGEDWKPYPKYWCYCNIYYDSPYAIFKYSLVSVLPNLHPCLRESTHNPSLLWICKPDAVEAHGVWHTDWLSLCCALSACVGTSIFLLHQ